MGWLAKRNKDEINFYAHLVSPAADPDHSVDNFWHNDLFTWIGSTCGGGEWRYLVDLHVNLTSHLALFLLLAF